MLREHGANSRHKLQEHCWFRIPIKITFNNLTDRSNRNTKAYHKHSQPPVSNSANKLDSYMVTNPDNYAAAFYR